MGGRHEASQELKGSLPAGPDGRQPDDSGPPVPAEPETSGLSGPAGDSGGDPTSSSLPAAGTAQVPPEEVESESQLQIAEYIEQLQRLKAEFDNYRKRVGREREEWFHAARADAMRSLLPVLDDLRRAREHSRQSGEDLDAAGLLLILKRFEDVLMQLGLEELKGETGTEFDPDRHAAVMTSASVEVPEGHILQTLEPGYLLQGRMLRPSKVSVSSGPAAE